mgnify:CR=1 FL=1
MWPYTEEENDYLSEQKKSDCDYDTYCHGAYSRYSLSSV